MPTSRKKADDERASLIRLSAFLFRAIAVRRGVASLMFQPTYLTSGKIAPRRFA
jgi:hypothetical protein